MKKKKYFLLMLIGLIVILSGCMSLKREFPAISTYSLDLGKLYSGKPKSTGIVLMIKRFNVSSRFEGKNLVYRTGEYRYESDYYHRFLISPATMFTEQVLMWLSASEKIKNVTKLGSNLPSDYILQGEIIELYGDFRRENNPKAVLTVQLALIKQRKKREAVFQKIYSQKINLSQKSVNELISAYNQGFKNILEEFEEDLEKVL